MKLPVLVAAGALAAGATVLLASTPASARPCPEGTSSQLVTTVAGHAVYACLPTPIPCDPGPCDPTQAPPQN
jgi:hypothetical protein